MCEDASLLSDHLGEARTKFVGGLNITSREGFGRPPSALLLVGHFYIALNHQSRALQHHSYYRIIRISNEEDHKRRYTILS